MPERTSPGSGTYAEAVRSAPNPQAAMIVLAEALDEIRFLLESQPAPASDDGWGTWEPPITAVGDDEHVEVSIKRTTDPARLEARRALAHAMELDTNLPDVEDAIDVYVKGGPLWLYTGNREFVMSLPMAMRQQMVLDVEQDDHQTAQEMGRDVLKDPSPGELPSLGGD